MITGMPIRNAPMQFRLPVLAGIIFWMSLHTWLLQSQFNLTNTIALWDAFIFTVLTTGSILVLIVVIPRLPKAGVFQLGLLLSLLMAFAIQWAGSEAVLQIVQDDAYENFLKTGAAIRIVFEFLTIAASGLSLIFYSRWKELQESNSINRDATLLAKEAELQKLQQQLQPHFLFNSLNSINALIMVDGKKAQQMVQQLSDFLRVTIRRADQPWIYLAQEMEYLNLYLAIEKVRFGHRLNVKLHVSPESLDWPIPTLVLQPLLENAIKFGLYGTTDETTIELHAEVKNKELLIRVSNPFDDDMQPTSGSGFGISGLKRRLYLIFTRNDLLITHAEKNIFTVTLTLPPFPNYESIAN